MTPNDSLARLEKPQSLDEMAYLHLKRAVLNCELMPGAPLTETQLAEEMGISRTPVRSAIERLEQEGYIVSGPFKGYRVAEISLQDVRAIYELREIVECHVVRETANRLTPEELDELESVLRAADQALESRDYTGYLDLSREFHHAFSRKFGNPRVSSLLAGLEEHTYRFVMAELRAERSGVIAPASYQEHWLILQAIREGDVELAVARMRDHCRLNGTRLA